VLCETFENLKVQIERVIFVITEKPKVVFAKCIGIRVISKQVKGGFVNMFSLFYPF
jgi:hypothetical protein